MKKKTSKYEKKNKIKGGCVSCVEEKNKVKEKEIKQGKGKRNETWMKMK